MIRRKVLVVDDELLGLEKHVCPEEPRDETYLSLVEELNKISPDQFHYEPLLCGSEEQVRAELRGLEHANGELLSIVDLVLDENRRFSEVGATELLDDILRKSRLTFFTTRRLEQAKVSTLVKFQRANRSAGLFPFEILQSQPEEIAMLLHRGLEYHEEGQAIDYLEYLKKKGFSDINILLISDFHFTGSLESEVRVDLDNLFAKLEGILEDRRLDLTVLLGDFTDKGRSEGFSGAVEFIKELSKKANFQHLPSDFLRIVPGNHDIVVPLAVAANLQRSNGKYKIGQAIVDGGLTKFGLQPFQQFRDRCVKGVDYFGEVPDDTVLGTRHWIDARWTSFGFIMVGFDSNSLPSSSEEVVGFIDERALHEFREIVSGVPREQRAELTLLILAHHYTGDGSGDRGIEQRDLLRKHCSELGFRGVVFVNGDRHGDPNPQVGRQLASSGTVPLEIAVPTFCQSNQQRQKDASRGAILLTFSCNGGTIEHATIRSFGFREGSQLAEIGSTTFELSNRGWFPN